MPIEKKLLFRKHVSEHHADVSGKNNPMYGKNIKDFMTLAAFNELRRKHSIASAGKNNPSYGKVWIRNKKTD